VDIHLPRTVIGNALTSASNKPFNLCKQPLLAVVAVFLAEVFCIVYSNYRKMCVCSMTCSIRAVVPKRFIVPSPFKHSPSSCVNPLAPGSAVPPLAPGSAVPPLAPGSAVPPLAPGSSALSNVGFCHHCKPATHTHYTIHLLNIRMSVILSLPTSRVVTKSSYRIRAQIIIINNFIIDDLFNHFTYKTLFVHRKL
jgi:hypothetical protein